MLESVFEDITGEVVTSIIMLIMGILVSKTLSKSMSLEKEFNENEFVLRQDPSYMKIIVASLLFIITILSFIVLTNKEDPQLNIVLIIVQFLLIIILIFVLVVFYSWHVIVDNDKITYQKHYKKINHFTLSDILGFKEFESSELLFITVFDKDNNVLLRLSRNTIGYNHFKNYLLSHNIEQIY